MASSEENRALIASLIRDIPDFPKPGVLFKDITPLLANAAGYRAAIAELAASAHASSRARVRLTPSPSRHAEPRGPRPRDRRCARR